MKKTRWFPGTVRPVRSGWYEIQSIIDPRFSFMGYWDNIAKAWSGGPRSPNYSTQDSHTWRGLKK